MKPGTQSPNPSRQLNVVLAILRCARGWSQDELSRESGVRNSSISDYERGRKVPELNTLCSLMNAMGYPLAAVDYTQSYLDTLHAGNRVPAPEARELTATEPAPLPRASIRREIEQAAAELARAVGGVVRLALVLILEHHDERVAVPSTAEEPPVGTNCDVQ